VLAHWNNSPGIDISPHSDTLFWFQANQSLLSIKINLFSPWYSWKIAELMLNNNHSLTHKRFYWLFIYSLGSLMIVVSKKKLYSFPTASYVKKKSLWWHPSWISNPHNRYLPYKVPSNEYACKVLLWLPLVFSLSDPESCELFPSLVVCRRLLPSLVSISPVVSEKMIKM
jgi:hypothetical protein